MSRKVLTHLHQKENCAAGGTERGSESVYFCFPSRYISISHCSSHVVSSTWCLRQVLQTFFCEILCTKLNKNSLRSLTSASFLCWDHWEKSRTSWNQRADQGFFLHATAIPKYWSAVSTQSGHHSLKKTKGMPSFRKTKRRCTKPLF